MKISEAEMFGLLMEEMDKNGLNQYEISNFSQDRVMKAHNLVYWNNEEYFGFGAGAHGYVNGIRYSNAGPLKKYMEPLVASKRPIFEEQYIEKRNDGRRNVSWIKENRGCPNKSFSSEI